jgi:proteasome lid subunit RPN8/RPN11
MSGRIIRTFDTAGITRGAGGVRSADRVARTREFETPELRDTLSPVEVRLSRFVRERMQDDCWTLTRNDRCEAGGFLFGRLPASWDKTVTLSHATVTGGAERMSGEMSLDTDQWRRAEAWLEANQLHDEGACGLWHSHPETRDATPSDADLQAFLGLLDWSAEHRIRNTAYSVGLILNPRFDRDGYGSWAVPEIAAYVTRRTPAGTPITERARITGR